ncbi:uncharacterized protein METZ01_LOCUS119530, partial [marine metagenome]
MFGPPADELLTELVVRDVRCHVMLGRSVGIPEAALKHAA